MPGSRERFGNAMRGVLRHAVDYHGRRHEIVTILAVGPPLLAETHDSNIELEEDENLYLSQAVRQYHADYGLEAGDNLMCLVAGESVYHAVAVFSDNDVLGTKALSEAAPE